jgi:hypothetical protein
MLDSLTSDKLKRVYVDEEIELGPQLQSVSRELFGIISINSSVSKCNHLHDEILPVFSFIYLMYIPKIPLE